MRGRTVVVAAALAVVAILVVRWCLIGRRHSIKPLQDDSSARLPIAPGARLGLSGATTDLSGVVLSANHVPIAGARVCATDLASIWAAQPNLSCAKSGPDGAYDVAVSPAGGGYTVAAAAAGFMPGTAMDGKPIFLAAGQHRAQLDIVLTAGGLDWRAMFWMRPADRSRRPPYA